MTNSDEANSKKKQDRALVTLALGLTEKKTGSVSPVSDEDLLAFAENQLGEERHAQVMHSIAHDTGTYDRWIELVQTMELVDALEKEDSDVAAGKTIEEPKADATEKKERSSEFEQWDLVGRFGSWLKKVREGRGVSGGPLGVALVAVLGVLVVQQIAPFRLAEQDNLTEFNVEWIAAVDTSKYLPEKSIGSLISREDRPYSTDETELAKGIAKGFAELKDFDPPSNWMVNPALYSSSDTTPDRGDESLYEFGRFVALSLIQCKTEKDDDYFESAAAFMRKLEKQHDSIAPDVAVDGSSRVYVCGKADAIINQLI